MRISSQVLAWPSANDTPGRLLGLPFVLMACAPGLVFGWSACIRAVLIASLASFLLYVPLTVLALNGGAALAEDAPAPPLTPRAYVVLLALWSATAWVAGGLGSAPG